MAETDAVILNLPSANWQKKVERFIFSPPLVWYVLRSEPFDPARLERLADALQKAYWPFPEKCAQVMARLYEQAGNQNKARQCRKWFDPKLLRLEALIFQAEFLLANPPTDLLLSRLWTLGAELYEAYVTNINPRWAKGFYGQLLDLATEAGWREFQADSLFWSGAVAHALGEYAAARECYQRALAIFEATGQEHFAQAVREKLKNLEDGRPTDDD